MIVCSCNRITDRAVRACAQAADGRPLRVLAVYGALGCKAQCGKCAPTIASILRVEQAAGCGCGSGNCICATQGATAEAEAA